MNKKAIYTLFFGFTLSFFSFYLVLGLIVGYLISNFYMKNIFGKKIGVVTIKSIYIPLTRNYKIHLHHWVYPLIILGVIFSSKFTIFSLPFLVGFFLGISLHDFLTDKQWYKVLVRV